MKIEIETPDEIAEELFASTRSRNIRPAVFVSELALSRDLGKIENRPDWQEAIQEGREDIRAGRVFAHEEVMEWHKPDVDCMCLWGRPADCPSALSQH